MAEIARLFATINGDASGLNKTLGNVKSDLNVAAKGFGQFESVVSTGFKAIAVAGAAAFAGVVAGMTSAIKTAASLEQQAANTAAVFGSMAPPVQEVKDLISELGLNPQLLVSMEQAGDAINMLAKNGIAWEAIAGGVAEKTVLLANATGADFALAADSATDALAIFKLGVEDMDRVVSSAVAMVTNSKFDMQDFAYVLANLAPTAAAMGISLEEMNAVVTMTASNFKSGRTAGTAWSLLLQNMTPQSESAAEAMRELNLITEEGQNVFFDANGDLKDMSELLSILQNTFGKLTAEQQINYSRTIFGREAYGALAAVLQINTAEFGAMVEKMGDMDAVIDGAATRTNTFGAAWALLSDTLTAVMGKIGDVFLPIFSELARELAVFVAARAPAVVEWFGKIAEELADVIEWVRAWVTTGDMFNEKWDEVSPKIQGVVLAVKGFIDIVRHSIAAIGDFVGQFVTWQDVWTAFGLLLGVTLVKAIAGFVVSIAPLLLVIGGAIAIVAALRTAWENDWLGLRTTFEPVVKFIQRGFASLSEAFWQFVADGKITSEEFRRLWEIAALYVGGALTLMWGHVKTAFANMATSVTTFAATLDQNIRAMTGGLLALQDIIIGLATVISVRLAAAFYAAAIPAIKAVLVAAAPFLGWIAAAIAAAAALRVAWENDWMGIRTAFAPVFTFIGQSFGAIGIMFRKMMEDGKITGDEWQRLWQYIGFVFSDALRLLWEATKTVFGNMLESVRNNFPIWKRTLGEWGQAAWQWIQDMTPIATQKLGEWTAALIKWLGDKVPEFAVTLTRWATAAVEWIGNSIPKMIDQWSVWLDAVLKWMKGGGLQGFLQGVGEWVAALWQWVMTTLWPKLGPELEKLGLAIKEALKKIGAALWQEAKEIAAIIVERWGQGIAERWQSFKDGVALKWQEIRDIPKNAWRDFKQWGSDIVEGLKKGIEEKWNQIKGWWKSFWDGVLDVADRFWIFGSPSKLMAQRGRWVVEGFAQGINTTAPAAFGAMDSFTSGILSRANALGVSLEGSLTQVAGRITALQNHMEALTRIEQVGAQQIANYTMPTASTGVTTGSTGTGGGLMAALTQNSLADMARQFARDLQQFGSGLSYDVAAAGGLYGSAYAQAYTALTDNNPDSDAVLAGAIHTLINVLRNLPGGNQLQINMAAGQTGNVGQDLNSAVQYLNALYAS